MQPRFLSAQLHFALKAQLAKCCQRQAGRRREGRNKVAEFRDAMQRQHKGWMEQSLKGNVKMFVDFSAGIDFFFFFDFFSSLSTITWAIFQYCLATTLLIYGCLENIAYYNALERICHNWKMCNSMVYLKQVLPHLPTLASASRQVWMWQIKYRCRPEHWYRDHLFLPRNSKYSAVPWGVCAAILERPMASPTGSISLAPLSWALSRWSYEITRLLQTHMGIARLRDKSHD